MLTRRQFIKAALWAGGAVAVPPAVESFLEAARASPLGSDARYFLIEDSRWETCAALCSRIVPTGTDSASDPGATEADAVVFIDRFLAAFELPSAVARNPAVWVKGRWSGRDPFPGPGGQPSADYPPDDFLSGGQGRFLGLTPAQVLSWRVQLYGSSALDSAPPWAAKWTTQVNSLIPNPAPAGGLRQAYIDGLDGFDAWSSSLFGVPYYAAAPEEQDLMLTLAGNVILGAVSSNLPLPSPPAPPASATALFPIITLHTFQATYGIPEYSWRSQDNDPTVIRLEGTAQWRAISYDGDTEPLGNSIFDPDMYGPGEGPNAGFGEEGVYVPFGGYREYRPVSTLDPTQPGLDDAQAALVKEAVYGVKGEAG